MEVREYFQVDTRQCENMRHIALDIENYSLLFKLNVTIYGTCDWPYSERHRESEADMGCSLRKYFGHNYFTIGRVIL